MDLFLLCFFTEFGASSEQVSDFCLLDVVAVFEAISICGVDGDDFF